jgi:hypothetical protein
MELIPQPDSRGLRPAIRYGTCRDDGLDRPAVTRGTKITLSVALRVKGTLLLPCPEGTKWPRPTARLMSEQQHEAAEIKSS